MLSWAEWALIRRLTGNASGNAAVSGTVVTSLGILVQLQSRTASLHEDLRVRIFRYLEEATFDNDFISIGSFSISMPPRQCVSESSIVGIDWPASVRCYAQLP